MNKNSPHHLWKRPSYVWHAHQIKIPVKYIVSLLTERAAGTADEYKRKRSIRKTPTSP
jgi:hypothetical protein